MKRSIYIFTILLMLFTARIFFAATIGSDTAVTRFNAQQVVQNGDRIAGFAWLAGGFVLAGRRASGTYDSIFPVVGTVDLGFGTLILNQDLRLYNVMSISHWGNITGNFHILDLPALYTCFPAQIVADLCTVTFQSNITHGTQVNGVSVSFDSGYVASATVLTATLGLFIDQIVNNTTLTNRASAAFAATVNGLCVDWHPSVYRIMVGTVSSAANSNLYSYLFTPPVTLALSSSINIGGAVGNNINAVAWHPSGLWVAVGRANSVAAGARIETHAVSGAGVITAAAAGTDVTTRNTCLSVAWNQAGTFLAAGTATGDVVGTNHSELRVYSFNSGTGAITLVAPVPQSLLGTQVNSVTWGQSPATANLIAVGVNFIANAVVNNFGLLLYQFTPPSTLTQISSTVFGVNVDSLSFSPTNSTSGESCLAAGLATNTTGELQIYNVDTTLSYTLTLEDAQRIGTAVLSVDYSPNGNFLATGGAAGTTSLYQSDSAFANTSIVYFSNLELRFNNNTTWNSPAVGFQGNSIIDGRNWVLSFSPTFTLYVEPNSSLLIKDITLKGLSSGQFVVDPSSTVSFQDVQIVLDNDYTFSTGRFEILKNLKITGVGHNFIYTSTQVSLIRSIDPSTTTTTFSGNNTCSPGFSGSLIIDPGVIFQYNSVNASNLIQLEAINAQFILNSATLSLGNSLQLTKGRFVIDGNSSSQGSGSLIIGDGVSAANNLTFEIRPAANLQVLNTLIYRNL